MYARPVRSVLALLFAAGCGGSAPTASVPADAPPVDTVAPPPADPVAVAPVATEAAPEVGPEVGPEALPPPVAPVAPAPVAAAPSTAARPAPASPTATSTPPTSTASATPGVAAPVAPEAPAPAPAAPVQTVADYTLDPSRSALYVQVYKAGETLAAGLSHDHVVAATGWSGTVRWDPADPAACKVEITVPVSGLRPDQEAMRKRVGYDVMLDDGQRADVTSNMLAAGQLDAKKFTDIRFLSTSCAAAGDKVKVGGTLTVHGVGKSVTSTMKITGDGAAFTASGTFTAKATDFGFEPYSALLGALKNQNEMKFTVDVRGAAR